MQAVPDDILEAAAYARTMTAAEVEAIIHRIVDEVTVPAILVPRFAKTSNSTAMTPFVNFLLSEFIS